ncbi:MAG: hypothetical protein IT406_00260 [Candidatus Yanofskybacteria bacterium]|nr:hypothetical protein [Candidatus Yanofskybacteria bacterium]
MTNTSRTHQSGQLSMYVLIFSAVSLIVLSGFVLWADANMRAVFRDTDRAQAFMSAEAGIEYYRWHLAHAQTDYQDGTGGAGPYVHTFNDKDGNPVGSFSLEIAAPPVGSTVVGITSTGGVAANPGITKIIEAKMAIPSFAKYAAVIGGNVRFGAGTELYGPIHSNGGIRMDGISHNLVTSSTTTYDDPDHSGGVEYGVHTHIAPTDPLPVGSPPAPPPSRSDIFMAGRELGVPSADFVGMTQNLANMKADAIANGFYRAGITAPGYEVVFNTNDTFTLYRVDSTVTPPSGCTNYLSQSGWGTWSVNTRTSLGTFPLPTNGIIFLEDDVWVRGQINTARVTVASGRFPENPSTYSSIAVASDLAYTNYDGSDTLALISQNNINIGMVSDTDLRVDAALMAQNGRVGRYYYRPPGGGLNRCSPYHTRTRITSFGMIGSRERYGFAYTDGTGYQDRVIIYDANLLYSPPPSFPLTADYYTPIYWNEAK